MFKGIIKILGAYVMAAAIVAAPIITHILHEEVETYNVVPESIPIVETVVHVPAKTYASTPVERATRVIEKVEIAMEKEEDSLLTQEEIELIALLTMAEAEGESEEGKRLVIDTVLNRVDSELSYFPDTVKEVIYQDDQFTSMWNGRVDMCYVSEDICELIKEELRNRTNDEVLWFRAGDYGEYGEPLLVEGNHYFSKHA